MPNLKGQISVDFSDQQALNDLCQKHIPGYYADRFEIIAIRVFATSHFIMTVFAEDKLNHSTIHPNKLMVKKFKIENVPAGELLKVVDKFNFTVFNKPYTDDEIEVINK